MTRYLIISLFLVAPGCDDDDAATKPADNTKNNVRDRAEGFKTPLDQSEKSADVELTAKIRSQLMDDESLSVNAQNIKIVTADGTVTLRGPVASEEERNNIATIARAAAGTQRVDNQLEVAAP